MATFFLIMGNQMEKDIKDEMVPGIFHGYRIW